MKQPEAAADVVSDTALKAAVPTGLDAASAVTYAVVKGDKKLTITLAGGGLLAAATGDAIGIVKVWENAATADNLKGWTAYADAAADATEIVVNFDGAEATGITAKLAVPTGLDLTDTNIAAATTFVSAAANIYFNPATGDLSYWYDSGSAKVDVVLDEDFDAALFDVFVPLHQLASGTGSSFASASGALTTVIVGAAATLTAPIELPDDAALTIKDTISGADKIILPASEFQAGTYTAAEANLAVDGVVTVLGVGSTIDLASGASIKVEGNDGNLIVGASGATTTFIKTAVKPRPLGLGI